MIDFRPMMDPHEIEIIETIIDSRRPRRVFEWGSGGSTVYFASKFPSIKTWVSVEHIAKFYDRIKESVPANVRLYLVPEAEAYINRISSCKEPFDLILVDGRWRGACLKAASKMLKPRTGRCLLHDSGRLKYHFDFKWFDHVEELCPGKKPEASGGFKERGLHMLWND